MNSVSLRLFSCARLRKPCHVRDLRTRSVNQQIMGLTSFQRCITLHRSNLQKWIRKSYYGCQQCIGYHRPEIGRSSLCTNKQFGNQTLFKRTLSAYSVCYSSLSKPTHGTGWDQSRRYLSLKPAALVDAAPATVQPYLKLIRLDKPIG